MRLVTLMVMVVGTFYAVNSVADNTEPVPATKKFFPIPGRGADAIISHQLQFKQQPHFMPLSQARFYSLPSRSGMFAKKSDEELPPETSTPAIKKTSSSADMTAEQAKQILSLFGASN